MNTENQGPTREEIEALLDTANASAEFFSRQLSRDLARIRRCALRRTEAPADVAWRRWQLLEDLDEQAPWTRVRERMWRVFVALESGTPPAME